METKERRPINLLTGRIHGVGGDATHRPYDLMSLLVKLALAFVVANAFVSLFGPFMHLFERRRTSEGMPHE